LVLFNYKITKICRIVILLGKLTIKWDGFRPGAVNRFFDEKIVSFPGNISNRDGFLLFYNSNYEKKLNYVAKINKLCKNMYIILFLKLSGNLQITVFQFVEI